MDIKGTQAWERFRWTQYNANCVTTHPADKNGQITYIIETALQICDEVLKNQAYTENKHYQDVLLWIEDSIKPYLLEFDVQAFLRISQGNYSGRASDSSEDECHNLPSVPRRLLQQYDSIESKSSLTIG